VIILVCDYKWFGYKKGMVLHYSL